MIHWLPFRFVDKEEVEWLNQDSHAVHGTLAELARDLGNRQPLLVVPGEAVLLSQVQVPGRNRATVRKAVPYALEDNLADDVEALHFAVGPIEGAGVPLAVAVIRHDILQGWLDACAAADITLAAAVPDPLLLPYAEGEWSLLLEEDRAVLRHGLWQGFATEQDNLTLLLDIMRAAQESGADGEPARQRLRVWGEITPEVASLDMDIFPETTSAHPLALFASHYRQTPRINLLQGPYSRQAQLGKWLRPWRTAAILTGCWLGLQLILQVSEYTHLQQEKDYLQAEMSRIYKEAVPEATRIVNPRVQLQTRLQELGRDDASEEAVFLELLHQGGQALANVNGITLRSVRYKQNQLDMDLESSNLETFDALQQRFDQQTQLNAQMRTTMQEGKAQSQVILRKLSS